MDNNLDCAICCESINNYITYTNCHCKIPYHNKCLNIWFKKSRTCPSCRKAFTKHKYSRNFEKLKMLQDALFYESIGQYNRFLFTRVYQNYYN